MAKKKRSQLNSVTFFSKTLAVILFILFPFIGFYLGMQYAKQENLTPESLSEDTKITSLSKPAKLVEEFYSQYVECLNNNFGSTKSISGDCDLLITTEYFTQELIDSMSGRSKAYCGYEPPSEISVAESRPDGNGIVNVVLWGEYESDVPTIIQLKQGVVSGQVYQDWQIDRIVCL